MSRPDVGIAERTLPHDLSAERAVLGATLIHNDAYEIVNGIVAASDFFRDAHRRIWNAIDRLLEWKGGSVDLVTLMDDLTKHGDLDECGGPAYLAALVDGIPRSTNVKAYAEIVKEKSRLRGLIFAANKMLSDAYTAEDRPDEILKRADVALVELQTDASAGHLVRLRADTSALLDDIEWRNSHRGQVNGITTGFQSVDDATLGWQAGHLVILAARPSVGKSTMMMNCAVSAAKAGKRVAVFSFEMKRLQLEYRMMAGISGVPARRTRSGMLMEPDWGKVSQAIGVMAELPIYIDDRRGESVQDVRSACRRMKAEDGLDLVMIDYVQLMPGGLARKGANRNDEIADISRKLSTMSGDLNVPVMLLSQLNRGAASRPDPRPQLQDLRDSGALEQDGDEILFLHRRDYKKDGLTYLIFGKHRDGDCDTLKLSLDKDIVLFTDAPDAEEPQTQAKEPAAERPRRYRKRSGED